MCIIFASVGQNARYPVVLAASRDESFARPTAALSPWSDAPEVIAGRDLVGNGTWMGINKDDGRWACLTAVHVPHPRRVKGTRSRGEIVARWLGLKANGGASPEEQYISELENDFDAYDAFNVLFGTIPGDGREPTIYFYTNDRPAAEGEGQNAVNPGSRLVKLPSNALHAVANASLETPWPKVVHGKSRISESLDAEKDEEDLINELFGLLQDGKRYEKGSLDGAGPFSGPKTLWYSVPESNFGTRSSLVVLARPDGTIRLVEKSFAADGSETGRVDMETAIGKAA